MKWAISNGRTFHITADERTAMGARRSGLKVTEVIEVDHVSAIPLERIVGRIGDVWYIKA